MKKVIVIGAGPAGMMAAITAAKNNNKVILLDGNEKDSEGFSEAYSHNCLYIKRFIGVNLVLLPYIF